MFRFLLFIFVFLWGLDNLGINITALVAGLGIGGIAIALAVQNILGDLFASFSIILDRPFIIGDFITVGDVQGTIEHIGIKTTRLRSLTGEQIIMPNSDLLQSRLRNFKRMEARRVLFTVGIMYETEPQKLEMIPDMIKDIILSQKKTRFERAHLARFGASSLDYEIVYWVDDKDYNIFADIHQNVNLSILKSFAQNKIEFAYPTQRTVQY